MDHHHCMGGGDQAMLLRIPLKESDGNDEWRFSRTCPVGGINDICLAENFRLPPTWRDRCLFLCLCQLLGVFQDVWR